MSTATQNGLAFTTASRRTQPIRFTLDDVEYEFTPPKMASLVLGIVTGDDIGSVRAMLDWLDSGLPKDQSQLLEARLRDPKDDLDFDTLSEVIQGLMAKAAGGPTTASSD